VGVDFTGFDGVQSLAGVDAVFMQANYNYANPDMPIAGQNQLVSFVSQGGGLVTSEWVLWDIAALGKFQTLYPILPSVATAIYNQDAIHSLARVTADPIINSGLPNSFDLPGDNIGGSEAYVAAVKQGATVFCNTTANDPLVGLSGWDVESGRVAQFSQTVGIECLGNPFGLKLLGNVME